jgi:hypothetical protein
VEDRAAGLKRAKESGLSKIPLDVVVEGGGRGETDLRGGIDEGVDRFTAREYRSEVGVAIGEMAIGLTTGAEYSSCCGGVG